MLLKPRIQSRLLSKTLPGPDAVLTRSGSPSRTMARAPHSALGTPFHPRHTPSALLCPRQPPVWGGPDVPCGKLPRTAHKQHVFRSMVKVKRGTEEKLEALQLLIHKMTCVQVPCETPNQRNVFLQIKRQMFRSETAHSSQMVPLNIF